MKVLTIGSDKNLLLQRSAVRARMSLYGQACDELHIVIPGAGNSEKISENVFIHPTGTTNPVKRISSAVSVGKKLTGCNLVTAQDPFEYGVAALKLGKYFNIPVELQVHTDIGSPFFKKELKNKLRMIGIFRRLSQATSVRVVSERVAKAIEKLGVSKERITVLPVFIDSKRFLDIERKPSENEKIIFMAGRLEKEKDYPLALDVFARAHKHIPETRLHIAGGGRLRTLLEARSRFRGISNSVVFLGPVADMTSHFQSAHVFLHTSKYEGFGAVLAEASLAGVPIVSTDVGIAGTLLKNGEHLRVVPVGEASKLEEALIETFIRPKKTNELALTASGWMYKNLMSPDVYVKNLKSAWEKTAVKH